MSLKLYDVVTLYDCMQDPATVAWLVHADIPLPGMTPPGRYPSPAEIRRVIESIPGIRAAYQVSPSVWQVTVTSRKDVTWASLLIRNFSGDVDEPHPFYFEAGWDEIIVLVTSHLAKRCGPLVLLHDSGAPPQVVM
jgi:hypothetical protein